MNIKRFLLNIKALFCMFKKLLQEHCGAEARKQGEE